MAKLVGVKVITTKAGNKGYEYHFVDDFPLYDKEHAECYGSHVFSEYSTQMFNAKVGEDVEVLYGKGFQGKAQLTGILSVSEGKVKSDK